MWRYSAAMAATRTTASGSSALTWKMGMGRRLAMSVAKREEFDSSGHGGEAEQIVDDDVDGAADVVAAERGQVEGLGEDALAGEGGVAVDDDGQRPAACRVAVACGLGVDAGLLGAGAAHGDGVDGFKVAGVRDQVERDRSCRSGEMYSPVAPMWYFTSPPPMVLRGSTSSNLVKISAALRPMVLVMTLRRPRWLMAMTDVVTPLRGGDLEGAIEVGDEDGEAFEREALGAEVARLDDLLEDVGLDEAGEDARLVDRRARRCSMLLLQPLALLGVGDVHELDADGAAVEARGPRRRHPLRPRAG